MNPRRMLELAKLQQKFKKNHPKIFPFLKAASGKALQEGSVIEISVTTPEGKVMRTNLKVKPEDLEIVEQLKQMRKNG
nr:hypothetical protein [uncultured Blautia sp.]